MLSDNVLREISRIFIGDIPVNIEGISYNYRYKTGGELVDIFNNEFGFSDVYKSGFPSRWYYVQSCLGLLQSIGELESFLSYMLNENYLALDMNLTKVESVKCKKDIINFINKIARVDGIYLQLKNNKICIVKEDNDLEEIGHGGFAKVYRRKSNDIVEKHLYEELYEDKSIVSRFKREFEITQSLKNLNGIVEVYEYKKEDNIYTMKFYEQTLEDYVNANNLSDKEKVLIIKNILSIMAQVHEMNIIHRDLSPSNIFYQDSKIVIGDFGLGKNLNLLYSHQTMLTKALGRYQYCDPEQFMLLREGDKKSDVYSLGRVINFIMTKNPMANNHIFKSVTEKACSTVKAVRYNDAKELLNAINKSINFHENEQNIENIKSSIARGEYNEQINMYISEMSIDKVLKSLCEMKNFDHALYEYIKVDNELALKVVNQLAEEYTQNRLKWEDYDKIADFMFKVVNNMNFSFAIREIAANVINYVAKSINRFGVQEKVKKLTNEGVEPLIEEILQD